VSRTQAIYVPKLKEEEIRDELMVKHGLDKQNATRVAQLADGSMTKALDLIVINEERQLFFDLFVKLMRLAYQRKIREMKEWSEQVAAMGRERQKRFLSYCMQMIRENFVYNFHQPELVHMSDEEQNFATRFAPFINERNVLGIMDELNEAQLHVEQNVNPKMIFFDFSLKMIVLLIQ
jgi:DNA polymerase-3 subunit delta'